MLVVCCRNHLFSFLSVDALGVAGTVCKRWAEISAGSSHWKSFLCGPRGVIASYTVRMTTQNAFDQQSWPEHLVPATGADFRRVMALVERARSNVRLQLNRNSDPHLHLRRQYRSKPARFEWSPDGKGELIGSLLLCLLL